MPDLRDSRRIHRDALLEITHLYLGLYSGISLHTRHRNEVHIVESKLGKLRNLRLDEYRSLFRVYSHRQVIKRNLDYVLSHLFWVVGIVSKSLRIGYHYEYLIIFSRILQLHASFQRPYVMSEMEFAVGRSPVSIIFSIFV